MIPARLVTTCVTLGAAITGCDKIRKRLDPPRGQAEASITQRDASVMARVKKEIGDILGKSPDSIRLTDHFVRDLGADILDTVKICSQPSHGKAWLRGAAGWCVGVGLRALTKDHTKLSATRAAGRGSLA